MREATERWHSKEMEKAYYIFDDILELLNQLSPEPTLSANIPQKISYFLIVETNVNHGSRFLLVKIILRHYLSNSILSQSLPATAPGSVFSLSGRGGSQESQSLKLEAWQGTPVGGRWGSCVLFVLFWPSCHIVALTTSIFPGPFCAVKRRHTRQAEGNTT